MKYHTINRSKPSLSAAESILAYMTGTDDADGMLDPVVSINAGGDLCCYNAACGTDDAETVLISRLEPDSMGDGWGNETPEAVIEWLETYCE